MNPIKFLDLKPNQKLESELNDAYYRVITSGQYIGGYEVEAFEKEWAEYCESKYCVSCSSGQSALELLLKGLDIGNGDWIGIPSWTAPATWQAVINAGCRIYPIEPTDNFLIGEFEISEDVVAIIPVHLYGYKVKTIIYSVRTIYDACQGHGLKRLGDAVFSFYPTKNLGAYGDGGAIVTNDSSLAEACREFRYSNRLDSLQAAFLRVKLKYLDEYNLFRQENADLYDELLVDAIAKPPKNGVYHQYVIRVYNRDYLKDKLAQQGIETIVHYPIPPHKMMGFDFNLPVADKLAKTVLSLPIMTSPENIKRIAEAINANY